MSRLRLVGIACAAVAACSFPSYSLQQVGGAAGSESQTPGGTSSLPSGGQSGGAHAGASGGVAGGGGGNGGTPIENAAGGGLNAGSSAGGAGGDGAGGDGPTAPLIGTGFITYERWNAEGESVADIPQNKTPDFLAMVASFTETSQTHQYAVRLRGFLTAPLSGAFRFWVTSDDNSELRLSTSESAADLARIAWIEGTGAYSDPGEWGKLPSQASAPITLTAGKRYRLLFLFKQGGDTGHFTVAWAKPGDDPSKPAETVPASQLSPDL
jgi:PA14 domain